MGVKWEDITDILTEKAKQELNIGQVLIFSYEGSPVHLKIMRKYKGKVWAKRLYLYLPEEVTITKKK